MDLRSLEYFLAVAEEGSFTKGAQRAHVVQSAASAAVDRLERELGVALFMRRWRSIELTEGGRLLLAHARVMLASAQAARDDIDGLGNGQQGIVRLGTVLTTGTLDLAGALVEFRRNLPMVKVHVRLVARPLYEYFSTLLDGTHDALVVPVPPHAPRDIRVAPVGVAQIVPVCGIDDDLAGRKRVSLEDLAQREQVDFPESWGNRSIVDSTFRSAGVERFVAVEVVDVATALSLAARGLGITFLDRRLLEGDSRVCVVDLADPLPSVQLGLATAGDRPESTATRELCRVIVARAAGSPSADGRAAAIG